MSSGRENVDLALFSLHMGDRKAIGDLNHISLARAQQSTHHTPKTLVAAFEVIQNAEDYQRVQLESKRVRTTQVQTCLIHSALEKKLALIIYRKVHI
jgi:hypothetical protein